MNSLGNSDMPRRYYSSGAEIPQPWDLNELISIIALVLIFTQVLPFLNFLIFIVRAKK